MEIAKLLFYFVLAQLFTSYQLHTQCSYERKRFPKRVKNQTVYILNLINIKYIYFSIFARKSPEIRCIY